MEQGNDQVCLFCEEEGCLILTTGNGKTVRLCAKHWSIWHRHSMEKEGVKVSQVYDEERCKAQ
jgi:hypothetical protein